MTWRCGRAIIVGVVLAAITPRAGAQSAATPPRPEVGIDQRLNEQVPMHLEFRDERGQPVTLAQCAQGKPVILVLAYYRCPRLCSLVLNELADALRKVEYEVGDQFEVITVSIDPRETPELAAAKKASYLEYCGRPGARTGWHFLTGQDASIKPLAAAAGFRYAYDSERDQYAHGSGILVLTPEGRISRYFYGVQYSPRDLQFGLEDASSGKIGSPVARSLRLLCFGYDPVSGQYTLLTMRLVRLAAAATVIVLGLLLWRAWRRERRKHSSSLPTAG